MGKSQSRSNGRKGPTVAGALSAFSQDLALVLNFARNLRGGKSLDEALGSLKTDAHEAWAKEEKHDAPASGPSDADAAAFARGLGSVIADADKELRAHRAAEKRTPSRKRKLG